MSKRETIGGPLSKGVTGKYKTVVITVKDGSDLTKVADDLKTKGFVVADTLKNINVLLGKTLEANIAALKTVNGVDGVEEQKTYYTCGCNCG